MNMERERERERCIVEPKTPVQDDCQNSDKFVASSIESCTKASPSS